MPKKIEGRVRLRSYSFLGPGAIGLLGEASQMTSLLTSSAISLNEIPYLPTSDSLAMSLTTPIFTPCSSFLIAESAPGLSMGIFYNIVK